MVVVFDPAFTRGPHGITGKLLVFYYLPLTTHRTPNSRAHFFISISAICLCMCCFGNVHGPLPSKIGNSVSGSTIQVLGGPSRCQAMDVWFGLYCCGFQASNHNIIVKLLTYFFYGKFGYLLSVVYGYQEY
jgi:hypothetical protein